MKKRILLLSAFAALFGAMLMCCSKDGEAYMPAREVIMANAEIRLGVTIDTTQSWQTAARKRQEGRGERAVWTYAFEDTPMGDYDMNDVVIKMRESLGDPDRLEVTLCCVGASFDLYAYLGARPLFGGKELHEAFGQPRGTLINTGLGPEVEVMVTERIVKPVGFTFSDADVWIYSPTVHLPMHISKAGDAPCAMAIPGDWQWPRERVTITEAYPLFRKFVSGEDKSGRWHGSFYSEKVFAPAAGHAK